MFNTRRQQAGETIKEYVEEVKKLSETCDFGSLQDRLIRDRLVIGFSDAETRTQLLRVDHKSQDQKNAVDLCKTTEAANKETREMAENPARNNMDVHQLRTSQTASMDTH